MRILNNYRCQAIATLVNINPDESSFCPFIVSVNKCRGSCTTNDDQYGHVYVTNIVTNMNIKSLNLISSVNETKFLYQHESSECKCRLNKIMKQKWNHNEFRCKKVKHSTIGALVKMITYGILARMVVKINHAKIDEYLDIKNCSCEKCLISK